MANPGDPLNQGQGMPQWPAGRPDPQQPDPHWAPTQSNPVFGGQQQNPPAQGGGPQPVFGPVPSPANFASPVPPQPGYPAYSAPTAQPYNAAGGYPGGAPPKKSRKGLFIGAAVLVVIAVVIAVVATVVLVGGTKSEVAGPKQAVQTYLDALAASDAEKALSVSVTPPSAKLLTDDVLRQQRRIAGISDIVVDDPDSTYGDVARVHATYKLGDKNVDQEIEMKKQGGKWKLAEGVLDITIGSSAGKAPGLTLLGVDISHDTMAYVFPGPLVWGSSNQNFSVTESRKEFPLGPGDYYYPSLTVGLSATGTLHVNAALDTYFTDCAVSTAEDAQTDRPGCTQRIFRSAKPGSVRWTKPSDLSRLTMRPAYDDPNLVKVFGNVSWPVSYESTYDGPTTENRSEYVSGSVDLSAATPKFTDS